MHMHIKKCTYASYDTSMIATLLALDLELARNLLGMTKFDIDVHGSRAHSPQYNTNSSMGMNWFCVCIRNNSSRDPQNNSKTSTPCGMSDINTERLYELHFAKLKAYRAGACMHELNSVKCYTNKYPRLPCTCMTACV